MPANNIDFGRFKRYRQLKADELCRDWPRLHLDVLKDLERCNAILFLAQHEHLTEEMASLVVDSWFVPRFNRGGVSVTIKPPSRPDEVLPFEEK